MSAFRDIAVYFIAGLLFACALQLRDIRNEMRMLTCVTLAENGIRCPALKETIAAAKRGQA